MTARRLRIAVALVASLAAIAAIAARRPADSFAELARLALARLDGDVSLAGLREPVEVIRDRWGVPHIYARSLDDLFFAQGFVAAQDRLWQMELWRRLGEGRIAELIGSAGVAHDRLVRLLKFRGPFDDREWTAYHPEGRRILSAYAAGINAFIARAGDTLPVEYTLTGLRPEPWRPETPLIRARLGAAIAGAREELQLARGVARDGLAEVNRRTPLDPSNVLAVPDGLDVRIIGDEVLRSLAGNLYGAVPPPELVAPYRDWPGARATTDRGAPERSPGSNNWAVRPSLSATGKAFMVDDPHREVTMPALRYLVHLDAPGWSVIGATEPGVPGVIRGHNGRIAWGRTATGTDEADVFVEELNPANPNEVRWNGAWEPLSVTSETIAVKGEAPRRIEVRISRHGPIFHEDRRNHRAYALRSPLQEPGTAEYLGGLRLDQAKTARDCLSLAAWVKSPSTNLVCADADGNIAFRVTAVAPRRRGWFGRLPVPGAGKYEWDGFRDDLPEAYNPPRGFIVTANNNIHPPGYYPPLFFKAGPPYRRYERITQMMAEGRAFTSADFKQMLRDSLNTEAVELQPWFRGWTTVDAALEPFRALVAGWDGQMRKESAAALLYVAWRERADLGALDAMDPLGRAHLIEYWLAQAVEDLRRTQGPDPDAWRWGRRHRSAFPHQLVAAYDLPALERSGGANTVNATGAVYRLITDFSDLDRSQATIAPGQSGQPGSPFYGNLLQMWSEQEFFPLAFTRQAVEGVAAHRLLLKP